MGYENRKKYYLAEIGNIFVLCFLRNRQDEEIWPLTMYLVSKEPGLHQQILGLVSYQNKQALLES